MLVAAEIPDGLLVFGGSVVVLVLTLGSALMSWVLLQAVKLGQIVSSLEARTAANTSAIEGLELRELQRHGT